MGTRVHYKHGRQAAGLLALLASLAVPVIGCATVSRSTFTNPIAPGADPWVIRHNGHYYFCSSRQNTIRIACSERLTAPLDWHVVWRASRAGWNRAMVWAPELHRLQGRWYIYYAASARDNNTHRVGVLAALTDDPLGEYYDCGPLYTGDQLPGDLPTAVRSTSDPTATDRPPNNSPPRATDWPTNRWAIDATVLDHAGRLYLIWSGWPADEDVQYLYIAPLSNPTAVAGPRVRLCNNTDYPWERVDDDPRPRGLHEGPEVLTHAGRTFLIYSCSASWLPSYKLGLLELVGDDPLCPENWRKSPEPVFTTSDSPAPAGRPVPSQQTASSASSNAVARTGPLGVGHASFTVSPDGTENWIVYHAKSKPTPGWPDRMICAQPFTWTPDGQPDFGSPVPWGAQLPQPAGSPAGP